jgi:hypothetical protein
VSPQLNTLIDNALAYRESLVTRLTDAQTHGRDIEAFTIEQALGELDLLLALTTRAITVN